MPRLRRRESIRREDLENLTHDQRNHLLHGSVYFEGGFRDRETFALAWEIHRDSLTLEFDAYRRENYFAPTWIRPTAWWVLDHGIERPVIGKWGTEDVIRQQRKHQRHHLTFGYLHTSIIGGCPDWEYLQMSQRDYLELHQLFTPEEEAWLAEIDASDKVDMYTPESFRARGVR